MNRSFVFVCNWKMYFTNRESVDFIKNNNWTELSNFDLIICPSFENISAITQLLQKTTIAVGGQDCSAHDKGPYTGQVAVVSLSEIGCTHCIIGHSETRNFQHTTNEEIAKKIELLFKYEIIPILCIGESKLEYEKQRTLQVLEDQLKMVKPLLKLFEDKQFIIAYEPVWAIGTNMIPSHAHLEIVYDYLKKLFLDFENIRFLYGGSVNELHSLQIKKIPVISGFLIGRASTNFQELKKIVLSI